MATHRRILRGYASGTCAAAGNNDIQLFDGKASQNLPGGATRARGVLVCHGIAVGDSTGQVSSYHVEQLMKYDGADWTFIGSAAVVASQEEDAAWDFSSFVFESPDVEAHVTGDGTEITTWHFDWEFHLVAVTA